MYIRVAQRIVFFIHNGAIPYRLSFDAMLGNPVQVIG